MIQVITKTKIKEKLRKHLNREPKKHEVENAFKDMNITNEIILDILEDFNTRLLNLEKNKK